MLEKMFDPETLLKENKELKAAYDNFISLATRRWRKLREKQPDEFAQMAMEAMGKLDEVFSRTPAGSSGTEDQKEGLREAFHRYVYRKAYDGWKTRKTIEDDRVFGAKMGQAFALLDASYMELDPATMEDPLFESAVRCLLHPFHHH